jgi:branched-chain amino acid transport system ATP-binding protein
VSAAHCEARDPLLVVEQVVAGYSAADEVLKGVDLCVGAGEIVGIIGPNGAGKSTLAKTIAGLLTPSRGRILLDGQPIAGRTPREISGAGIAYVPQEQNIFPTMSVRENLEMGAYLRGGGAKEDFDRVYSLFPLLHERRGQLAGTLSGGEQQMVAMGRALMSRPKLLLMDEPSMGLAPILVEQNFEIIKQVHESGVAILVVEQNANVSLAIADRGYVLQTGRVVLSGRAAELLRHEDLRKAYLGR